MAEPVSRPHAENAAGHRDSEGDSQPLCQWQARPLTRYPGRAAAAIVLIWSLAMAAAIFGGSLLWGVVAVLVMIIALNRFFFPSRFTVDDDGILAEYPLRKVRARWVDLRRFAHDSEGGVLSSRTNVSRLPSGTTIHLIFPKEPEHIIAVIKQCMQRGRVQREQNQPDVAADPTAEKDAA